MRKLIATYLTFFALLFAGWQCHAQVPMSHAGLGAPAVVGGYTGPGDVVSGAAAWYGVRAYSAATRGNPALNLCNVNDATCSDVSTDASTGNLSFGGTIGGQSCNFSVSSGTYTTATGAVSLTVSSSITGSTAGLGFAITGLTGTGSVSSLDGVFATVAGTTGTTVNYTAATGLGTVTITGGTVWVCSAKKIYDQTQGNNCTTSSCDLLGASPNRFVLVTSCLNSLPCLFGQGGNNGTVISSSSTALNSIAAQPYAVSAVAARLGPTGNNNVIYITATASNGETFFGTASGAMGGFAGTAQTITGATEGSFHGIQNSFNGASGNVYVDGTASTKNMGAGVPGGVSRIGGTGTGNMNGEFVETGIWPVTFVGSNAQGMCNNQSSYWALGLTCN